MKEELKRIDRVLTNYDNLNLKLDEYLKILENDNEMYSQLKDEYENIINQLQNKINRIDAFINLHTTADSDYDGNMWYEIYDISESQFIEGLKDIL